MVSEDDLRSALVTVATSSVSDTIRLAAVDKLVVNNHAWNNGEVDAVLARLVLTDPAVCERATQGILGEDALREFVFDDFDGAEMPQARRWTFGRKPPCSAQRRTVDD